MKRSRYTFALTLVCATALTGCTALKKLAYEGFGRDRWQQPERVIESLEIKTGHAVADIGSGTGYFTFRLARVAGPDGKVYAVDLDEGLIEYIEKRAGKEGLTNIEVILAEPDDPKIPASGVDLIFTSNTFHHFDDSVAYFSNARKYLRSGGRVAVIDFRKGHHATPKEEVRKAMEAAGYRLVADHDYLKKQSLQIFTPNGAQ